MGGGGSDGCGEGEGAGGGGCGRGMCPLLCKVHKKNFNIIVLLPWRPEVVSPSGKKLLVFVMAIKIRLFRLQKEVACFCHGQKNHSLTNI